MDLLKIFSQIIWHQIVVETLTNFNCIFDMAVIVLVKWDIEKQC